MGCGLSMNLDRSDNYRIGTLLDTGRTGEVYLAEDISKKEPVAIKFIPRHKVNKHVEREVLNFSRCQHSQIISFREVFLTPTHLAICMEFAEAGNLLDYLNMKGPLKEEEARSLFQQLIAAVDHCHYLDIILRDIKPENTLLISLPGERKKRLKICDFGTSRTEATGYFSKSSVGTPIYSAPEALVRKQYDGKKADVWSAGVVLFCMIYGRHPFVDGGESVEGNLPAAYFRIVECQYELPKEPKISDELRDLLQRILVKDPEERMAIFEIYKQKWFKTGLPDNFFDNIGKSKELSTEQSALELAKWKKMIAAAQSS